MKAENPKAMVPWMLLLNDGNPYHSMFCMLNWKDWCGSLGRMSSRFDEGAVLMKCEN